MDSKLRLIAATWSLVEYPSPKKEWSFERKIRAIKEAGFHGFTGLPNDDNKRLAEKYGLQFLGHFSSAVPRDFTKWLQANADNGAKIINVQLGRHDTTEPEALKMALRLRKESQAIGCECFIETHRNTCTETPEKTYALAESYWKATGELLPLTLDYSHLAVVKHLLPPDFIERLLVHPKLIQHTPLMHLRPFNGHHCQIPITDGKGNLTPEVKNWIPFCEALFRVWRAGKQDNRELFVVPELGPALSGYNLYSLPNSWEEALVLKGVIEKCWKASAKPLLKS
jgi:hypothetical protein